VLPFFAGYCLLLMPRSAFFSMFDRYLLPILAVLLLFALRWHQEHVSPRVPAISIAMLALVALLTVVSTHDFFAMDRARVQLASHLQRAGVPRTAIRGGFSFDGTTQIDAWGYVNEPDIVNPPGAYRPTAGPAKADGPCDYWFQPLTPAIHAQYAIAARPTPCLGPSSFTPVSYRTWLPPATRHLFIGTVLPRP
jgi:hypothetical protein